MIKLTNAMRNTLSAIFQGRSAGYSKTTILALIDRGLLGEDGHITEDGRNLAITFMSLEDQSKEVNLPIYKAVGPYNSAPEYFLWNHFKKQMFDAAYCEGGAFLTLLKSAVLPVLTEINTFNSQDDACQRFLEAQFTIHKEQSERILDAIVKVKPNDIEANFEKIYSHLIMQETYPGLYKNFISSLFKALGSDVLCDIARLLFEDPYTYRNGWPDLTLVKDGKIWLVEVKTTDRFHLSQIITIPKLIQIIPAKFMVIQIKNGTDVLVDIPHF